LPRRVADKYSLYQLCREMGMASPEVRLPDSPADALDFAARVGYPLIAKATTPWLTLGAIPSTSVIHDPAGLADVCQRCDAAGAALMLQEFIPGGQGDDWFFHGYCDADSVCRLAFTGIKERSFPLGAGGTMYGRSAPNGKLRDEVTALLTRLAYQGVMDLDLRRDARDGQYHLLDFNPRFGAQFRVFRDTAGMDLALAAYLDLTGQPIPSGEQVSERYFMAESYDPLAVLAHWRRGEMSLRTWLSQLRAVDEFAWFARDDLRPFGLMCLRMAWKTVIRPIAAGRPAA
jgi:D-aspartate ligase